MMNWMRRGVLFFLAIVILTAILSVVLFSLWPHIAIWWGDKEPIYLQLAPCDDGAQSTASDIPGHKCYPAESLLNLTKALRISDAIGLLAILVAVVTLMLPVFGFLSIKLERRSVDKEIDDKFKLERRSMDKEIDDKFREFGQRQTAQIRAELSRINHYPTLLSFANYVADLYSIDLIRNEEMKSLDDVKSKITEMIDSIVKVDKIRSALTNLLEEENRSFMEGISTMSDIIDLKSPIFSSGSFIPALKKYLYMLHDKNYVDNKEKRDDFKRFIENKLHYPIESFLAEQSS
uniref:Uncharacterized protein n=1 Tax=Candidatus Kentrum sp. MB TaxID=2138164 RepID=A0A450XQA0_9GAMM|nr:MAG: hypothetical protein BECKMB1821I_GA0114274_10249 [Candidatus Kentron sp. MB]VFK75533.1 MAG: hypothetical protein BECKMB1821H_GA0114242_10258 [Candidatus Kentron sp. MB]